MIRFRLIAALAVLFVAPGAAQVTRALPPVTPMTVSPQAMPKLTPMEVDRDALTKVMTPEEVKALQSKLRETRIELRQAIERIDQMTKLGGSLVKAYCEPGTQMSRNTAGASEDCAASGYACDQVSGTCHRRALNTTMCATGFVMNEGSCVTPASIPNETD
jgi:hypothetical protein